MTRTTFCAVREAVSRELSPLTLSSIYQLRPGPQRRALLLTWLRGNGALNSIGTRAPGIPVNNRWQPNTVDPDLQYLLKRGLLVQYREGGGARHPKNRSSRKRQTYLVLASQAKT